MKDVALYYPKMTFPPTGWLSRTLLYWDEVATIVPEAVQAAVRDDPYMAELIDLGLLRMVDPAPTLLDDQVQSQVQKAFSALQSAPIEEDRAGYQGMRSMRAEKLLYSVRRQLEEQGQAWSHDNESGWLRVPSSLARWYMPLMAGLMASSLSADGSISYKPITDDRRFIQASNTESVSTERKHFIYRSIHEVLPGPSISIPPREIVEFKNQYSSELRRLRGWIDDQFLSSVNIPWTENDLWERRMRERVAEQVEFLREGMNRRRWPKVLVGTVGALFGNGMGIANSSVSSDSMLELGLGLGSATIAAATSMPAVVESARRPRYDPRAPLAYAALTTTLRR
ncbi:hypothetical protein QFZ36_003647 [Pseudarthrobacter siccitolerans]|uniref:Uncharacterized protein n=1 Tax=Pseudarthrobacter siccitolerans TaxID=861266 RepID=A0ABU0PS71_9MICC|nr:hypothetical protein [Pseudarthrobacter siccitolerans]MDQ0676086.1 hypothetical protein [Pseudarthrobacter siccitolerans]